MINSLNFLICNFIVGFLVTLLSLKIFKISHSKWYILSIQIFDVCAGLISILLNLALAYFILIKLVSVLLIVIFITDSFKPRDFFGLYFIYWVLFFSVGGIMLFLCEVFSVVIENLFSLKINKSLSFIIYFAIILYIFAIFDIVSYLDKRRFLNNHLTKLSFFIFGKHIEIVGFIDSGNSLYDSLTRKPVIIVSKRSLEKHFSPKELALFLSSTGRVIECETIGSSNTKLKVYDIKAISYSKGETIKQKPCVVGVMDKVFENAKYDCLLHRDFM